MVVDRVQDLWDVRNEFFVDKLWLEVTFTVQGSCLDEAFLGVVFHLEKNTVSRDLLAVMHLDDVADRYIFKRGLFELKLSCAFVVLVFLWQKAGHWSVVCFHILAVAFYL